MATKDDQTAELPELPPPSNDANNGADEMDADVKGGAMLSPSATTSGAVLKQSTQLSTSVDPGKVQGFQCNGLS